MSLQTTHNTTTTSLQRELDTIRKEHQNLQIQLRELEMGNDDLERNERAISSSLADVEQKYAKVLEEKILLEHELLDKATVEEECQRLKDELRGALTAYIFHHLRLTTASRRQRGNNHFERQARCCVRPCSCRNPSFRYAVPCLVRPRPRHPGIFQARSH